MTADDVRQQIALDLKRVADACDRLAGLYPRDRESYLDEARAYRNASAIAAGDDGMVDVLISRALPE